MMANVATNTTPSAARFPFSPARAAAAESAAGGASGMGWGSLPACSEGPPPGRDRPVKRTLANRIAVVVDGGGPLGRAMALALAARGARVVVAGPRERTLGETVG